MNAPRNAGRLHVLTDTTCQDRFDHVELARLAAEGGADVVQFREKRALPARELERIVDDMRRVLAHHGCALVVNDRVTLALRAEVDGLHLGRNDTPAAEARAVLGPDRWIGVTANSLEEALAATRLPVDYLGVGPVFGTGSKSDPAPPLGLARLAGIVARVDKPVIAIGNITAANVADVMATGVHGVAVLAAVARSADPRGTTERLARIVRRSVEEMRHAGA